MNRKKALSMVLLVFVILLTSASIVLAAATYIIDDGGSGWSAIGSPWVETDGGYNNDYRWSYESSTGGVGSRWYVTTGDVNTGAGGWYSVDVYIGPNRFNNQSVKYYWDGSLYATINQGALAQGWYTIDSLEWLTDNSTYRLSSDNKSAYTGEIGWDAARFVD